MPRRGTKNVLGHPHQVTVWDEGTYAPEKRASYAAQLDRRFPQLSATAFEKPLPMLVLRVQTVFPYPEEQVHLYADKVVCNRWWPDGPQSDPGVTPEDVRAYGFQLVQFVDPSGSAATCETTAPINLRPQFNY